MNPASQPPPVFVVAAASGLLLLLDKAGLSAQVESPPRQRHTALPKAQIAQPVRPAIKIAPRHKNKNLKNSSKFACQAPKSTISLQINKIQVAE
jgi:hypothetical protein